MNQQEKSFRVTYDPEADAVMITLARGIGRVETQELGQDCFIDFDSRGRLIGVEILNASEHYDRKALEQLPDGTEWLTLAEAAREAGLAPDSIRSAIRLRRLRAVKRGRGWLVAGHELLNYLGSRDTRGRKPARKPRKRRPAAAVLLPRQEKPIAAAARRGRMPDSQTHGRRRER